MVVSRADTRRCIPLARENGVTVEKTDEECVIEGFRALVRIATRVVLDELPTSSNSEKREEVPVMATFMV